MATPALYNTEYLSTHPDLSTAAGLAGFESEQQYHMCLNGLRETLSALPATLSAAVEERRFPQLHELTALLRKVGCAPLALLLEGALTTRSEPAFDIAKGRLHALQEHLTKAAAGESAALSDSAVQRGTSKPADGPTGRAAAFSKLVTHMEFYEFDEALAEVKAFTRGAFGLPVQALLDRMEAALAAYEFEEATAACSKLTALLESEQAARGGEKKKILAIDDAPDILATVKNMLRDRFAVYGAINHMAALKFLTETTPDLILLDIEMPGMDGFTLLRVIRQMDRVRRVPVLFLTGNVSVEYIKQALESGGNDFLRKPVDYQVLLDKIGKHLPK